MPDILDLFKNPETFAQLNFSERLVGSLYVILLGMGIVFAALVVLMLATQLMSFVLRGTNKDKKAKPAPTTAAPTSAASSTASHASVTPTAATSLTPVASAADVSADASTDDGELVAVIAAAIAASLNKSVSDLVVTKIRRVPETAPTWMLRGRAEAMNNR